MRKGFTSGSCAAAAAKAAAYMLVTGKKKESISLMTPAGIEYRPALEEIVMEPDHVHCAVRKDSGDDPDVTSGTLICADLYAVHDGRSEHTIEGGVGVGVVTRPGLDQKPGEAAINSVPRRMIAENVREVTDAYGCEDTLRIVISVPEGEELAKKTFNPRLGIEGGISIIGTSGIIEPMSTRAILDTIRTELKQLKAEGHTIAVVSPGNYGLDFMKKSFDYDLDRAVKCSNYIGDTIDMAAELGYGRLLLCGHVGKLIKLSGGIMNTHSSEADCRMELLAAAAARCGADGELLNKVLDCINTEEALSHIREAGILKEVFDHVMEKIAYHMARRAGGRIACECMVYSSVLGMLGETPQAEAWLREDMAENKGEGQ